MTEKCLLILPRSVIPFTSGYALKNKNVIEMLHKEYDLTLVVMKEEDFSEKEKEYYRNNSINCIFWIRPKVNCYFGALRSLIIGQPLQVGYYYDQKLHRLIDEEIEQYDVAIAVLDRTVAYLKNTSAKTKCVFDMVDSIALNYKRSSKNTTSLIWRILYSIEANRLLEFEKKQIQRAHLTYLINQEEYDYWKRYGNVKWLPHGVKEELLDYSDSDSRYCKCVAFIGKMDYQPNVDAMVWYIKYVHSEIGGKVPLIIVGANPTDELKQLAKLYENITIMGYVDDPYVILNSALALIAPMKTGGGIQNKVLEGMALGKINVISGLAAKPIVGAKDKKHFLVADSSEEYVTILSEISRNPERYAEIGAKAKEHIKNTFTWDAYNKEYLKYIEEI